MGRGQERARARMKKNGGWSSSWVWAGALGVVLVLLLLPTIGSGSTHHPEPREHIGHEHVVPAERYEAYPRVAEIYEMVAATPHVIDGIYCYCDCSQHSGHYSLLDCFHDDHAARCDICLSEAAMAHRMHNDGESLDDIRTAIDRLYDT
ncbi:MAG: CYCXC family (seleno)protein [Longimicrobiales bacterium]|nr:CYCXC family (seleno)protein [Longimicrobiales bacterium]